MRDIRFKAKRKDNGEWIYGHYYQIQSKSYMLPDMIEVISDTVCQYTGLKDKDGQEIWENDLLGHKINVVEYSDGCFWIAGDRPLYSMHEFYSVIGNIFDNTDLIESR